MEDQHITALNPAKRPRAHPDLLPCPDFPLFPHVKTGRWAKTIRGRRHYFGRLADGWQAALTEYERVAADLHAGRAPRPVAGTVEVRHIADVYLTARQKHVKSGELHPRTWAEYHRTLADMVDGLGRRRPVAELRPEDFGSLRADLSQRLGPATLGKYIQIMRSAFAYAWESALIETPMRFGPDFKKPDPHAVRRARQDKPVKMLDPVQIRSLLDIASPQLRAMILLGVNVGFGCTDCAELPASALDLKRGIVDFPRPNTTVERRGILWPETIKALREAMAVRPDPRDKADAGQVFLTSHGRRWVRFRIAETQEAAMEGDGNDDGEHGGRRSQGVVINSLGQEFARLMKAIGAKQPGVGFYSLRSTFRTIAADIPDEAAIDRLMGHGSESRAAHDRKWRRDSQEDQRLHAITDHVRAWLFDGAKHNKKKGTPTRRRRAVPNRY